MASLIPLAERLRPTNFDNYIGQKHLIGEGAVLRKLIDKGLVPSMILWGTPGIGKTTLANIIAHTTDRPFFTLSAINSGVKDVREVIDKAKKQQFFNADRNPILFIDEIHRFSKSQQDSLLGAVEQGIVTLIGATTENPSFEVISALLSRCQVYILEPLTKDELLDLIHSALKNDKELSKKTVELKEYQTLMQLSGGDARKLLNLLELTINHSDDAGKIEITNDKVIAVAQQTIARYDKDGEQHYDIISAFIKSIRGSDPNAAVYWLARMIEGGEDAKFIARRLLILASEDIGNANPTAIVIANNCFQAVNVIGWPESRIILSQAVTYLACSAKSNAAYMAINKAQAEVKQSGNLGVPLALRNAPTKLMKEIGYGKAYKYSHDGAGNFVPQEFMPEEVANTKFYDMGDNARERELRERMKRFWNDKYGY
ncbi:replication-associated recombination protein A [Vicingaceae bacterium]|jgi:putative ATPase|nr:replication-associated recombination protein A [Vicingaceae bacterium]